MRQLLSMWWHLQVVRRLRGMALHVSGQHPWVVVVRLNPGSVTPVYWVRCERCDARPSDLIAARFIGNALHDRALQSVISQALPQQRD